MEEAFGRECVGGEDGKKGGKREGLPIKSLPWAHGLEEDIGHEVVARGTLMRFLYTEIEVMIWDLLNFAIWFSVSFPTSWSFSSSPMFSFCSFPSQHRCYLCILFLCVASTPTYLIADQNGYSDWLFYCAQGVTSLVFLVCVHVCTGSAHGHKYV